MERTETTAGEGSERLLRREIGFTGSAFLSFNGLVGAGIFALPGTLHAQFGTFSPWLFPIFGLLVLLVALPFARVAGRFPVSGGPLVYAAAFGPVASFQVGWLYYVARATALAANTNVLIVYLTPLWPPLGSGAARAAAILGICALLTAVNLAGVRRAVRLLDLLTLLKAAPLVAMAAFGLLAAGAAIPPPGGLPSLSEVEVAALLVLYAFVGFENSVVPAGETADAERTIPRALIATIAATAALYFLVQLAYISIMPEGPAPDAPLVAFGTVLAGPAGAMLMTAAAIFSLMGNISGGITATTRATYALGRDGLLPAWFASIGPRFRTPSWSILFMGGLVALLAITGSFVWLAVVSTLARLVVYSVSIAALPHAGGRRWTDYALMAAGLAVCLWAALQSEWPAWRMLLILAAAGTLLYLAARFRRR